MRLCSLTTFVRSLATALLRSSPLARRSLELGRDRVERVGHGRVQHHVRERDALTGRDGAELELVAGEGERAGAVTVARVARQLRQDADADVERATVLRRLRAALLDLLEDVGEHVAEEDRQDRRRRLVCAQAMIVARARDAGAQQTLPPIDGTEHGRAEDQELHVVVRRVARAEQVVAELVGERPVIVLARSIDAGEWLLVQQAGEPVFRRNLLQHLHRHHLMIDGDVGVLEDRCDLVLARRDLIVPGLHRDADLE